MNTASFFVLFMQCKLVQKDRCLSMRLTNICWNWNWLDLECSSFVPRLGIGRVEGVENASLPRLSYPCYNRISMYWI